MLPTSLNVVLMLVGYLLVMGYLALGLRILRRGRVRYEQGSRLDPRRARRFALVPARRGWRGLMSEVMRTAVGGYLLLMIVVVGYYQGVARAGGDLLLSAVTGAGLMVGIALPLFFVASWAVARHRRKRAKKTRP